MVRRPAVLGRVRVPAQPGKVRLFVGITPTTEALAHAAGAVDRIAPTTPDMRWVSSERWHVTLAFLGAAYPDRLPALRARLDHVADRLAR